MRLASGQTRQERTAAEAARLFGALTSACSVAGCASSNAPSPVADYDLIYSAGPDGNADVYIAHLDGTEAVQLTTSIANEFWPSLSPDGSKILFASWRTNQGGDLPHESGWYGAVGADRRHQQSPLVANYYPAWSPDGGTIAFVSNRANNFGHTAIYAMRSDGTHQTRLTEASDTGQNESPAWSPDGRRIAFLGIPGDGPAGIFLMNANGSRSSPADFGCLPGPEPLLVPGRAQLAFTRQRPRPYPPG